MSAPGRSIERQRAAPTPTTGAGIFDPREQDSTTSFLLAEHARLSGLYLETRETADRRTNLFLTLTTTIVGVIIAAVQFKLQPGDLMDAALAGSVGIVLLGAITFHRLLERSMQGTEYLRAINRIHRYFVERAPEIEPYLFWPACDDVPAYDFRGVGGAEQREIVVVIDSVFAAASGGLAVLILAGQQQLVGAVVLGLAVFVAALLLHRYYEAYSMAREQRRTAGSVRFPKGEQQAG